jgi:hypothetical protein
MSRPAAGCTPSSAEVKNAWSHTSAAPHCFMAWCLINYIPVYSAPSVNFKLYYRPELDFENQIDEMPIRE